MSRLTGRLRPSRLRSGRLKSRLRSRPNGRSRGRLRGWRRQDSSMVQSRTKFFFRMCVSAEAAIRTHDAFLPLFELEIVAFVTRLSFERTRGVFVFADLHGPYSIILNFLSHLRGAYEI